MNRRNFIQATAAVFGSGAFVLGASDQESQALAEPVPNPQSSTTKEKPVMKIVLAADPFAVQLKDAVVAHLKSEGHEVVDVGSTTIKDVVYYECCVPACKMLQEKKVDRAILFCGTGMGMSVVANRFPGIVASCVESVFATKMCRVINDANALCLGAMIWGEFMALEAVDTFLHTKFTETLPDLADFLQDARKKVKDIRP